MDTITDRSPGSPPRTQGGFLPLCSQLQFIGFTPALSVTGVVRLGAIPPVITVKQAAAP